MKELDQFTVEELSEIIRIGDSIEFPSYMEFNGYQAATLARIALAAKTVEPFAYMTYKGYLIHAGDPKLSEYSDPTPIYDAPILNSPETPDGWVSCSERMPVDCQTVLCSNLLTELSGIPFIADYVGAFQLYDGTKYEAGFYVNRELQTVTHWMPLPAPPKPEK